MFASCSLIQVVWSLFWSFLRVLHTKPDPLYQEGKQHFKVPRRREISVMCFVFFFLPRWAVVRTSRRLNLFRFSKKKKKKPYFSFCWSWLISVGLSGRGPNRRLSVFTISVFVNLGGECLYKHVWLFFWGGWGLSNLNFGWSCHWTSHRAASNATTTKMFFFGVGGVFFLFCFSQSLTRRDITLFLNKPFFLWQKAPTLLRYTTATRTEYLQPAREKTVSSPKCASS